ncbi:MAG: hypothetical protein M5U28_06040 [Sandaracinaceae bacterium]|nr:hypothetical protein [Sandaracinaceae bacterium]
MRARGVAARLRRGRLRAQRSVHGALGAVRRERHRARPRRPERARGAGREGPLPARRRRRRDGAGARPRPRGCRPAIARPLSVARALVERVELGEREGELATHQCRLGQQHAECVTGWTVRGDRRFARHGALFEIGARIVWLDVAGPVDAQVDVSRKAREILESVRLEPREDLVAAAAR